MDFDDPNYHMKAVFRFWALVKRGKPDECWEWKGTKLKGEKYGRFKYKGKSVLAHRFAYMIHTGKPVPDDLMLLHSCDNEKCTNIAHLSLGTHQDNMDDRNNKERFDKKITSKDVKEIIELYEKGDKTQDELAAMFSVTQGQISRIVNKKRWGHLK